jgi:hypothetical protein
MLDNGAQTATGRGRALTQIKAHRAQTAPLARCDGDKDQSATIRLLQLTRRLAGQKSEPCSDWQEQQKDEEAFMDRRRGVAFLATGAIVIASAIGAASHGVAQDRSGAGAVKLAEAAQKDGTKATAPRTVAPRTAAPRTLSTPRTTTRTVTPKQLGTQRTITTKRTVTPKVTTPRVVTPKVTTPKITTPKVTTPRVVSPKTTIPKTTISKTGTPKTVSPTRLGLRTIGPSSTGKTLIRGRNYTVWRGTHRVRHDGRWATLAAISALSIIVFSGADYYPYAYISATGPYCEGITDDGCVLKWEEVPTLEGPWVYECVAYCPWR